jgi:hypothetical protein
MEPGCILLKRLYEVTDRHPDRWSEATSDMSFRLTQPRPIHIGQFVGKDNIGFIRIFLFENHDISQEIYIYQDVQPELYGKYLTFLLKIRELVNSNLYGFFVKSIQEAI